MLKWSIFLNCDFRNKNQFYKKTVWSDPDFWITSTFRPYSQAGRLTGFHFEKPLMFTDTCMFVNNWLTTSKVPFEDSVLIRMGKCSLSIGFLKWNLIGLPKRPKYSVNSEIRITSNKSFGCDSYSEFTDPEIRITSTFRFIGRLTGFHFEKPLIPWVDLEI